MEAPSPLKMIYTSSSKININEVKFTNEEFKVKLNEEIFNIMIGSLNEYFVIKVYNKSNLKNNYISCFTYDNLKNISKSMRYFDDINDIIFFIEGKGKKNELYLKKENDNIFIEFKISSPNGKEENVSLKLNPQELNDKEIINNLNNKVESLEKKVEILNCELEKNKKDSEIKYDNLNNELLKHKKDIEILYKEIKELKEKKVIKGDYNNNIDSKIVNYREIEFIVNYLNKTSLFQHKHINFNLLYRGTRDGDNTIDLHNKCDKRKNVIIFMKSEQGNRYGGFSHIGWENRKPDSYEYPIDDNSFLFTIDKQKIFEAIKGKNKICWINSDQFGLCFYASLVFYNHFLTKENTNIGLNLTDNFKGCTKNDFNSGIESCKFSELEVFYIS